MSGVSLPVNRTHGRALIVASAATQAQPIAVLQRLGFECAPVADPYAAMIELCRRPLVYRAVVLSLQSLYREELPVILTIKRRLPHLEIWLTHTDGRQAAMAEAQRMGADGLLAEDGLHRTGASLASGQALPYASPAAPIAADSAAGAVEESINGGEPVLTADELRALLQEQPSMPPSGGSEP